MHASTKCQQERQDTLVGTLQERGRIQPIVMLPEAEQLLSTRDARLARLIEEHPTRWPSSPTEDRIWGLVRIVMAQQVSTRLACQLAERAKTAHPRLTTPNSASVPNPATL